MTNYNDIHKADIVITTSVITFVIWQDNDVIANATRAGRDLIVAGAAERKLSVYDTFTGQFLCGDLGQLTP